MSRVDYYNIEDQIRSVLAADSDLSGVTILVEEEISAQRGNVVAIYLDDRSAPDSLQGLSAGQRTRFLIRFTIWCFHFGISRDRRAVMEQRDDLVGKVEIALMKNRNLNNSVVTSWLSGGEFISGPDPTGKQFMVGASITLECDAIGSTV